MSDDGGRPRTAPDQAFGQLGLISLAEHTTASVLQKVAELTRSTVPGADEVSVTLLVVDRPTTAAHTGALALALDEQQYEQGHGPCLAVAEAGETVSVQDMRSEQRWPDYTPRAVALGALSSLSVPVPVQQGTTAALNVYGARPRAFDAGALELAQTFASFAGVALANMQLYEGAREMAEQMQAAMRSRAVIEQAKGVLMAQRGISAAEAFDVLVVLSQHGNRKLRDVAVALVASVSASG